MNINKRILSDGNDYSLQLHPLKYPWAWDFYLKMIANTWTPMEIPMAPDVAVWRRDEMPEELKEMFLTVFAQLTTFDHQRSVDLAEVMLPRIQAPEIKHALIKQAEQEALHTWAYQFCIENLGLDQTDIYSRWERVRVLKRRVNYANDVSKMVADPFSTPEEFIGAVAFWYLGFEGVWFMLNLRGPVQALARTGRWMTATAEQFLYIAKDEELHIAMGAQLVRDLIRELKPDMELLWAQILSHFETVLILEEEFISTAFKSPWIGYSVTDHVAMAKWFIDRRLRSIGFPPLHKIDKCPIPWMSEAIELKKERNFFETRVTEYQVGGQLSWDAEEDPWNLYP